MSDSSAEDVVVYSATSQDQPAAASAATETTDSKTAASSTAEAKPAETTFDRIKAAVTKSEVSPPSKEPEKTAEAADPAPKATENEEFSEDELKGLHAKTRERFGKLTSKLATKDSEIASLSPKAAEYDKIDTFIKNAGLRPEDVSSTFQMAALLRSDKRGALEKLRPLLANLERELGETLPSDLQTRVDQGYLTEEDARAVARSAAHARLAESRATELTEQQRVDETNRATKQLTDTTVSAVETWEKQKSATDPDWSSKREEVAEQVEIAIERKSRELKRPYFPTADEAVKLSEAAVEKVNGRFKRFAPRLKQIDPPVTAGASSRSVAQPKNTLDIVRRIASGAA